LVLAMIPDVSRYIRARKTGKVTMEAALAELPMGRMMNRMMDRMGLQKRDAKPKVETTDLGGEA
jgi:hypothetical protein